jgi:hypothetical protein
MNRKLLSLVAVLSLWGCAAEAPKSSSTEAGAAKSEHEVSARAEARWQAMMAKDLDRAHEFLSPGSKAAYPPALFKAKIRPLDWRSAKALSASCTEDKCDVRIEIVFFDARLHGEVKSVLFETWIKDAGKWWYVFNG